jgi:hypothetical protein
VPVASGNALLFRRSVWLFGAFAAAVVPAFWPRYFSHLASQPSYHAHAHGLVMLLWCALLVAQASLIRMGHRAVHRQLGRLSYLLVPLIVLTTVNFVHFRVRDLERVPVEWLYLLALILNALPAFVLLFALAIYHRRTTGTHARYMICTLFPLFTPVTDRLIGVYTPALVPLFPTIGAEPVLPLFGFALADAMLVALLIWDWRANRRRDVFPVALLVLLTYHVSVLTLHRVPQWRTFAEWFISLPFS